MLQHIAYDPKAVSGVYNKKRFGGFWNMVFDNNASTGATKTIYVDGQPKVVQEGANFADTCRSLARGANIEYFSVFINGSEVNSGNAPQTFANIGEVTISKLDKDGGFDA
jgi:hypothetical protein